MSVERRNISREFSSTEPKKSTNIDVDPTDVKMMVLDYLFTNNMSEIAEIFSKESGIDPATVGHSNRRIMESFQSELRSRSYSALILRLSDSDVFGEVKGPKMFNLLRQVVFRLHQLVVLQKIEANDDPEDILAYAREYLITDSVEGRKEVDRVLIQLLEENSAESNLEIVSKVGSDLMEFLSIYFNVDRESRLEYLLKLHTSLYLPLRREIFVFVENEL